MPELKSQNVGAGFADAVNQFIEYLDEFDDAQVEETEQIDFPGYHPDGRRVATRERLKKSAVQKAVRSKSNKDSDATHLAFSDTSCAPTRMFGTERCILLTILLFALFANVELLAGDGKLGGFFSSPHPYWLIILPMAAGSGLGAGVVAAIMASALYIHGAYQELGMDRLLDVADVSWLTQPGLFIATALMVGAFRTRALSRHQRLWCKYEEISGRNLRLSGEIENHITTSRELRAKLVEHSAQFQTLINTAKKIETATDAELLDLALDLVQEHCGAVMCSVLSVMDDGELDIYSQRGWDLQNSRRQLEDSKENPLVQRALRDGLRGNGFKADEPEPLFGPILVAPITGKNGVVDTILCLDEIPIKDLEEGTTSLFFGIADWISASLRRIESGQEPQDFRLSIAHAASVSHCIGSAEELGERLRVEDGRSEQSGLEASIIAVQALNFGEPSTEIIEGLDVFFTENFASDLRPSDGFYSFIHPGCYIIVLPGTTRVEANLVRKRLVERAQNLLSPKVDMIEFTTSGPSTKYPTLAKLMKRISQLFHAHSSVPMAKDADFVIPDRNRLGSLQDFGKRIRTEWSLALRNRTDFYVIDIKCDGCSEEVGEHIAHHVHQICESALTPTDCVYRTGQDLCSIILPSTTCERAFDVLEDTLMTLKTMIPLDLAPRVSGDVFAVEAGSAEYHKVLQTLGVDDSACDHIR